MAVSDRVRRYDLVQKAVDPCSRLCVLGDLCGSIAVYRINRNRCIWAVEIFLLSVADCGCRVFFAAQIYLVGFSEAGLRRIYRSLGCHDLCVVAVPAR